MERGVNVYLNNQTNDEIERERIEELISGMDKKQLEMVVNALPPELCYKRVGTELEKMKRQLNQVKNFMEV